MRAADVLRQAQAHGVEVWAVGEQLRYSPRDAHAEVLEALRQHKAELLALLREGACGNHLTPHKDHEHRWECDPDECYCWRTWRKPRWCQGVPCRWVWPSGSRDGLGSNG